MDQDLIDLISACKGEDIAPARSEQLLARLRRDDAFQQCFVEEIRMLGMLKAVQSMEPRWLRLQDALGWHSETGGKVKDGEDELMERVRAVVPGRSSRRWKWRAVATIAAGLLVAVTMLRLWVRAHEPDPAPFAAPARVVELPYPKVDAEDGLALVVKLDRVRWDDADVQHPKEGDLLAPGRLRIKSGRATFCMLSGVVLIVEGPADLDLLSIDRIFCRQGNLRTRVPKGAEGLVVSSPRASVLDLGTEFGLNIEPGGTSRVKVFEGLAEALMRAESGHESLSKHVKVGAAFELDPKAGQFKPITGAGDFIAPLDLATPSLVLDPGYPSAVLESQPWGYWRFESMQGGSTPNEVSGRPALLAVGPVRITDTPEDNHAAVFKVDADPQYFTMDGLWEPTQAPGYAVELWFMPESIDHASLLSMPAPENTNHHFFFLEMGSRNRYAVHPPGSIRFLDRWPPALGGGHNIYSERPYIPYRWHHVVGQLNRGRMELYLNGEPTYSLAADLSHPTIACQVLIGRLTTVTRIDRPDHHSHYSRAFAGRLDEVAVYNHPLTLEEIKRHRQLATQKVRDARPTEPARILAQPVPDNPAVPSVVRPAETSKE